MAKNITYLSVSRQDQWTQINSAVKNQNPRLLFAFRIVVQKHVIYVSDKRMIWQFYCPR